MSRPKDIKPDSEEPRDRLPLYPEIGFRHKFTEMIDAPTNAHRYRVTDRSVLVISSGPYGHPAGATGVHARRTATLPEAVGRRQRGSAMFAAKPHEAEQELPKSIPEPRNVTRECRPQVRGRRTWDARPLLARETISHGALEEDRAFQQEAVNVARARQRGPPGSGRPPRQSSCGIGRAGAEVRFRAGRRRRTSRRPDRLHNLRRWLPAARR